MSDAFSDPFDLFLRYLDEQGVDPTTDGVRSIAGSVQSQALGSLGERLNTALQADAHVSGKTLILYAGLVNGEPAGNIALELATKYSDIYYVASQTAMNSALSSVYSSLLQLPDYNSLDDYTRTKVEFAFHETIDSLISEQVASQGTNIYTIIGETQPKNKFDGFEINHVTEGVQLNGEPAPSNAAAIAAESRAFSVKALGFAGELSSKYGESIGETVINLDILRGFDSSTERFQGQTQEFWKTLSKLEAAQISSEIYAGTGVGPNESIAEATGHFLDERLSPFERYMTDAASKFTEVVKNPVNAVAGTLIGAGFVGTLAANVSITAREDGFWAGAIEGAIGGTALVVGGLAFAGVSAMLLEAGLVTAATVSVIGIGVGSWGLVNEVDKLIARLQDDSEQGEGSAIPSFL